MLRLVDEGLLELSQMVDRLATGPAKILGLDRGSLTRYSAANICIVDADKAWQVDEKTWLSRGLNTPFLGQQMKGQVTHTIVNGRVVFKK
jgi:dihydroorotase